VPGDVPLENILAFMEVLQSQPGFREMSWEQGDVERA
jgi:hypothetical protein